MYQIAKNASFNLVAMLIALIASTATSIISARILGPSELGIFSFVIWLFTTLVLFIDPGMSNATEKFVAELEGRGQRAEGNSLTLILLVLNTLIGLLFGTALIVSSTWLATTLGQPAAQPYLTIMGLGLPIGMTLGILRRRLSGFQRYDLLSIVSIVSSCVTLIGTALLLAHGFGVGGVVWLTVGANLIQLGMCAIFVWRQKNLRPLAALAKPLRQRVFRYCAGIFFISCLDLIILHRFETLFLSLYSNSEQIGYYGLAYSIVFILSTTVPVALGGVLIPAFSQQFGAGERESLQRIYAVSTKYASFVGFPICLGGIAIAKSMVHLLYGEQYISVAILLQILFVATFLETISGPGSALFLSLGKPDLALFWKVPLAILTVGLGYVLVPMYAAVGAATTRMICQSLGGMALTLYLARYQRFRIPYIALLRTGLAAGAIAFLAYLVTRQFAGWGGLAAGILIAMVAYVPCLILTGAVDSEDIFLIRTLAANMPKPFQLVLISVSNIIELTSMRMAMVLERKA